MCKTKQESQTAWLTNVKRQKNDVAPNVKSQRCPEVGLVDRNTRPTRSRRFARSPPFSHYSPLHFFFGGGSGQYWVQSTVLEHKKTSRREGGMVLVSKEAAIGWALIPFQQLGMMEAWEFFSSARRYMAAGGWFFKHFSIIKAVVVGPWLKVLHPQWVPQREMTKTLFMTNITVEWNSSLQGAHGVLGAERVKCLAQSRPSDL